MKTIGFVDYYISEWHANNYPAWIDALDSPCKVAYAWAEEYVSPVDGRNTDEWCRDFGVERCNTIAELCEKSDYILVLAPSNPEKHLGYAEQVLRYCKNTYIDKTFAPDYATAKRIFEIADRYGTRVFSSSALRYADELKSVAGATALITLGGGGSMDEYIVHQLEMAVALLSDGVRRVKVEKQGRNQFICRAEWKSGARASMIYAPDVPFALAAENENGGTAFKSIASDYFKSLLADVVRFFQTGEPSFGRNQTLEIMRLRECILRAQDGPGEWRSLDSISQE